MNQISASHAKQNFGEVLAQAALQATGIVRHGKLVATLVPAHWVALNPQDQARREARAAQAQAEQQRLLRHLRWGVELLAATPGEAKQRISAARKEVDKWQAQQLCSADYIQSWRTWLALPVAELVHAMCSDAQGWGEAMRQNSPFAALAPMQAA